MENEVMFIGASSVETIPEASLVVVMLDGVENFSPERVKEMFVTDRPSRWSFPFGPAVAAFTQVTTPSPLTRRVSLRLTSPDSMENNE